MHKLYLQRNVVCYDNDIFHEFMFWKQSACDTSDTSNFDHQKIKLSRHAIETSPYSDDNFLLMIKLEMENKVQINVIRSYKLMEFFGDIIGFSEVLQILCSLVGSYFSS